MTSEVREKGKTMADRDIDNVDMKTVNKVMVYSRWLLAFAGVGFAVYAHAMLMNPVFVSLFLVGSVLTLVVDTPREKPSTERRLGFWAVRLSAFSVLSMAAVLVFALGVPQWVFALPALLLAAVAAESLTALGSKADYKRQDVADLPKDEDKALNPVINASLVSSLSNVFKAQQELLLQKMSELHENLASQSTTIASLEKSVTETAYTQVAQSVSVLTERLANVSQADTVSENHAALLTAVHESSQSVKQIIEQVETQLVESNNASLEVHKQLESFAGNTPSLSKAFAEEIKALRALLSSLESVVTEWKTEQKTRDTELQRPITLSEESLADLAKLLRGTSPFATPRTKAHQKRMMHEHVRNDGIIREQTSPSSGAGLSELMAAFGAPSDPQNDSETDGFDSVLNAFAPSSKSNSVVSMRSPSKATGASAGTDSARRKLFDDGATTAPAPVAAH